MKDEIVAAVDFGSRMVRVVIARRGADGQTRILGYAAEPAQGCVRFGAVQDVNASMKVFRTALAAAQKMAGVRIFSIYCGIHGVTMKAGVFEGKVPITNGKVTLEHLENARDNASAASCEMDSSPISSVMSEEWSVDDVRVADPVGMHGSVLKGRIHFAQLQKFIQSNLLACMEEAGLVVEGFVYMPLAAAAGCLTCEDMQLGVAVADMGSVSTGVAVYLQGGIHAATSLNLGCGLIVNDVAAGLKVNFDEATELVLEYGISERKIEEMANPPARPAAERKNAPPSPAIKLKRTSAGGPSTVSRDELDGIIFYRSAEIAEKIAAFLKKNHYVERLARGIVLTGGGASLHNQDSLMEAVNELAVRIGVPNGFDDLPEALDQPEWAPIMGIMKYAIAHRGAIRNGRIQSPFATGNSWFGWIRRQMESWFI